MQLIALWTEAIAVPVMLHGEKSPAFIHTKPHHSSSHRKADKALIVWILLVSFEVLFSGAWDCHRHLGKVPEDSIISYHLKLFLQHISNHKLLRACFLLQSKML